MIVSNILFNAELVHNPYKQLTRITFDNIACRYGVELPSLELILFVCGLSGVDITMGCFSK
ncbi:MAG TPA: hypothetical protein TECP_00948 [Hyphomicrobiaceae bacterium MAG_BT-2024]